MSTLVILNFDKITQLIRITGYRNSNKGIVASKIKNMF